MNIKEMQRIRKLIDIFVSYDSVFENRYLENFVLPFNSIGEGEESFEWGGINFKINWEAKHPASLEKSLVDYVAPALSYCDISYLISKEEDMESYFEEMKPYFPDNQDYILKLIDRNANCVIYLFISFLICKEVIIPQEIMSAMSERYLLGYIEYEKRKKNMKEYHEREAEIQNNTKLHKRIYKEEEARILAIKKLKEKFGMG